MHSLRDCVHRLFFVQLYNFSFSYSLLTISAVISRGRGLCPHAPAASLAPQQPEGTCENLRPYSSSVYNPLWLPAPLGKILTTALRNLSCSFPALSCPCPCPSLPLPLPHSAPAQRVFSLLLQHVEPASSMSSLHAGCSLCLECPSTSFKSLLKCHGFQSPSLTAPTRVKSTSVSPRPTPLLPYQLLTRLCTDCMYYHSSLQNARQGF